MKGEIQNKKDQWGRWLIILLLFISFLVGGWRLNLVTAADYPTKPVLFFATAKPGSGFDTILRAMATTLGKEKLIPVAMPVETASRTAAGVATIVLRHKNDPYMISVQSLGGMLNYASGISPYYHKDFTPIARLASVSYGVIVRYDSPYKALADLLKDLKANTGKIPFSGGFNDDRIA
jgi:putative tricarboxylic transport membrane protein